MANYGLRIGQLVGYPLAAGAGSYALSGQTAGLTYTPVSGAEPYSWYPSFDKQTFPPHTASGVWGAQSTVKEAVAPTGAMVDVTAANAAELATHIYTPNRRITLTGNITSGTFNAGNITDVDLIVPPGITMNRPAFGSFGGTTTITRFRIRGNTVGTHSGGQLHNAWFFGPATDIILDGLDTSSPGGNSFAIYFDSSGGILNRIAVTNCKGHCGGYWLLSNAQNVTVTGCSVLTGVGTVSQVEAWGGRFGPGSLGNIIIYGNDIRSSTNRTNQAYHRIRYHPNNGLDSFYVANNRFIDRVETRIFWSSASSGGGTGDATATWFTGNNVIAATTNSSPPAIEGNDTFHAIITNNTFESNTFLSDSNIVMSGITSTTKTGNTYAALPGSDPSWLGAGDPTSIPWDF